MRTYKAKSGKTQYMPSIKEIEDMDNDCQGFCLACGERQDGCEPDTHKDTCESCGAPKVYGAQELALMGLVY